ncbi:TIGR02680 family protein [Crossiella sp. NPDC003009]
MSSLPEPERQRWQPLRAGLVDLFYYDQEEFHFRDGRLLLRGNNGTGKSKVLALMLPFLLDGELSPHRVEPDADPKKRMEWNLLLGGAHPHPERLGYTWLEFGRRTEDGGAEYRTLGCGLKAVSGRGVTRHWFFVTTQRLGQDLALVDATATALTRDRLGEALGGHGRLFDRAGEYRRAVDEALFGLGEQRYGALVDLLIQLRQPQLSKRPSEKALSAALTESLPPLDQAVVADVAEAFRSLEEDRAALASMVDAEHATASFLRHYRRYARVASRRRAALPRQAQKHYERVNRSLTEAQQAHEEASAALGVAEHRLAELAETEQVLRARDEALRTGPDMRTAVELDRVAGEARRLAADSARLDQERVTAEQRLGRRQDQLSRAEQRLATAAEALREARALCSETARAARLGTEHARRIDAKLPTGAEGGLRELASDGVERQRRSIQRMDALHNALGAARDRRVDAARRADELATEAAELADRRTQAGTTVGDRGEELVTAVRGYLATAEEIAVADEGALLAELALWVETLDGPNPARTAVQQAGHTAVAAFATATAELTGHRQETKRRQRALTEEIERLTAGVETGPPTPHTRAETARQDRPGAPLWQVVDFADGLAADARAGLEAALEAAGVLDAWVSPAGALLDAPTQDVLLQPAGPSPVTSLATVLRPAVDRADPQAATLSDKVLEDLLGAIGLGEQATDSWVDADGRFRLGVLTGAWHKPEATYIGRGAREAARRARLAAVDAELAVVTTELTGLTEKLAAVARRRTRLSTELTACPEDTDLHAAHNAVSTLNAEHARLVPRQEAAAAELAVRAGEEQVSARLLAETAADLDLPAEPEPLAEIRAGLGRYEIALASLWPLLPARAQAERTRAEAAEELETAERHLADCADRATVAAMEAAEAAERHRTLAETVGAAVAELQQRLARVAEELGGCKREQRSADAERIRAATAKGKAEGETETLTADLTEVTEQRGAAAEALRRFARTGLLTIALPELTVPDPAQPWAPDPTVRLARQVERELTAEADDDTSWDRAQGRVTEEFKTLEDTLGLRGNSASLRVHEDGIHVDVVFHGRAASVPELAAALAEEVGARQRLLDEREREILENHLVNEVASTLQELISAAEAQVARMNTELSDRPTSTGMRLRLLWTPVEDGPAGLDAARERLLRQTSDAWSETDRSAVGAFLQARIAEVRAEDESGTWLEHLTTALDYRGWHRFVIQRHQNGQWRSATGPASGGERVLAASVPLFAAASSHYASAGNPHAPRLVTLDEAFAGVDDNARAKYLGLLASFDLDVVMTSEREWGCYPEVPGLAIAQLSRTDDVPAVLVTSWEWDGAQRCRVPGRDADPVGPQESLWS